MRQQNCEQRAPKKWRATEAASATESVFWRHSTCTSSCNDVAKGTSLSAVHPAATNFTAMSSLSPTALAQALRSSPAATMREETQAVHTIGFTRRRAFHVTLRAIRLRKRESAKGRHAMKEIGSSRTRSRSRRRRELGNFRYKETNDAFGACLRRIRPRDVARAHERHAHLAGGRKPPDST